VAKQPLTRFIKKGIVVLGINSKSSRSTSEALIGKENAYPKNNFII
jgi:hypothetical protein